jgi:LEA14-like dessication related protein
MRLRLIAIVFAGLLPAACAGMLGREPLQVTVNGVEPLPAQGMELRLLMKLRVQNPNDAPIEYDGVTVNLDVQGKTFATGLSDAQGSVPRFGEAVIEVPVTVSAMGMLRQMADVLSGQPVDKIRYEMTGKLHGAGLQTHGFVSEGEMSLSGGRAAESQ